MGDTTEHARRDRIAVEQPIGQADLGAPRRRPRHVRAIIDSLDDELMVIDTDLRITQVNAAVARNHGSGETTLIGRHCYEVSHGLQEPCASPECECPVRKVLISGKSERVTHVHAVDTDSGSEDRYVDIIATPITDDLGNIVEVVELLRDTTEARRLERQILEANRTLAVLNTIAGALNESMDLQTVLEISLDSVMEVLSVEAGAIMLLDHDSRTLSHYVHRGLSEEFVTGVGELALGEGIVGQVALLKEPVVLDDISQDPGLARSQLVAGAGHRAFCSVPLQAKDRVLGVLNVGTTTPRKFSAADVQILTSIASQVAIAIENRMLYKELRRKDEMRGELLRQIITTQEDERKRIARELHDETSQSLTGLAVSLEVVMNSLPLDSRQLKRKLRKAQSIALGTLDGIHNAIYELRPSLLDDLGLAAAVGLHAEKSLKEAGIQVKLETVDEERRLPIDVETALFRIFQEASTNIIRHAHADSVRVGIHLEESSAILAVEDNGSGFDINAVMNSDEKESGLGLLGMRERAEFLGGSLTIRSRPGEGTLIEVAIPVQE